MKISKKDALTWFEFFAALPEDEELMTRQQELVYATFSQIEDAVDAQNARLMAEIPQLHTLDGRTDFTGDACKFPQGCRSCLLGSGLSAIRKTNRCNAACKFCYDYGVLDQQPPIGEGMWEIGGTKFNERDIDLLLTIQKKPTGVAYVYLEPFMEIEKYYPIIRKFHDAQVYQHLYTNGISATEAQLKALGENGLNELRFNLGASGCDDRVIRNIAIAKRYIPSVGIETPMTPEFYDAFLRKKQMILDTQLDFINCAELHLNENNIENYAGENLYSCRLGYVSPIWSRALTLRLMALAVAEAWDVVVHDCSNHTKIARDLNLGAKERGWFGASSYGCEFSRIPYGAFLPILRDPNFMFLTEEPLPSGYRPGELVF